MDLIPSLFSSFFRRNRSTIAATTAAFATSSSLVQFETANQAQAAQGGGAREATQRNNLEFEEDEEAGRRRPILHANADMDDENDLAPTRRRVVPGSAYQEFPKKRAFMLAAFLSCLSCVIIIVNVVISFAKELTRNDELMKRITDAMNVRNDSMCPCLTNKYVKLYVKVLFFTD